MTATSKKIRHLVGSAFAGAVLASSTIASHALEIFVADSKGNALAGAVIELSNSNGAQGAASEPYVMDQVDKAFLPKVLVVPVNSKVSFPNSDDIRHHVYSFSEAKTFQLKLYSGKPEAPVQFGEPGIIVLGCNIHDSMVGYIYVAEANAYLTDENGMVSIPSIPESSKSLTVWHRDAKNGANFRKRIDLPKPIDSHITVRLQTVEPTPRNTFEDVFRPL